MGYICSALRRYEQAFSADFSIYTRRVSYTHIDCECDDITQFPNDAQNKSFSESTVQLVCALRPYICIAWRLYEQAFSGDLILLFACALRPYICSALRRYEQAFSADFSIYTRRVSYTHIDCECDDITQFP